MTRYLQAEDPKRGSKNNQKRNERFFSTTSELKLRNPQVVYLAVFAAESPILSRKKSFISCSYIMHQWHPFIINTNWHNERLNFMQMSHDAIGVLFTTALAKRSSLPAEKKSSTALQKNRTFIQAVCKKSSASSPVISVLCRKILSRVVEKRGIELCHANLCNATHGFVSPLL